MSWFDVHIQYEVQIRSLLLQWGCRRLGDRHERVVIWKESRHELPVNLSHFFEYTGANWEISSTTIAAAKTSFIFLPLFLISRRSDLIKLTVLLFWILGHKTSKKLVLQKVCIFLTIILLLLFIYLEPIICLVI